MSALSAELARGIVDMALAGPRSDATRRIAVVVVDAGGHPLCAIREADAPPLLLHIAEAKARSCVLYGKPTRKIMEWAEATPTWFEGVSRVAQSRMDLPLIGSLGGVTIRDEEGIALGAAGVAGEAGTSDEALAVLGIESVGLVADSGA